MGEFYHRKNAKWSFNLQVLWSCLDRIKWQNLKLFPGGGKKTELKNKKKIYWTLYSLLKNAQNPFTQVMVNDCPQAILTHTQKIFPVLLPSSFSHSTQRLASTWKAAQAMVATFCFLVCFSFELDSVWLLRLQSLSMSWTSPLRTRHFSSLLQGKFRVELTSPSQWQSRTCC